MWGFAALPHFVPLVQYLTQQTPLGHFPRNQPCDPFDESFNKLAEDAQKRLLVPGFSISVIDGDETYARGYGLATLPDINATADTLYYVGSTTKSFTATSLLKLMEETADSNKPINLQTKIADLIDWKLQDEYATAHVMLEDVLSHRTGLPRYDFSYGAPNSTVQDVIDSLPHLPLTKELRQQFQYCNIMFMVAGEIVQRLSHSKLGAFFHKHIWQPLGMKNTFFDLQEALDTGHMATGYFFDNATKEYKPEKTIDPGILGGAGGVISSVSDFAVYLRAVMHQDQRILSNQSFAELRTARSIAESITEDGLFDGPSLYSLGWVISVYRGIEIFHHSGGLPGYMCIMLYAPALNFAVAVMTNGDLGGGVLSLHLALAMLDKKIGPKEKDMPDLVSIWEVGIETRVHVLKNIRQLTFPDAPPVDKAVNHTLPLKAYVGSYYNPGYRFVNLTLAPPTTYVGVPIPSENNEILHAKITDKARPYIMDFEHLNADHFLVRYHLIKNATTFDVDTLAMRAEFRIGIDGKVSEVGISYETAMTPDLLWFKKVE